MADADENSRMAEQLAALTARVYALEEALGPLHRAPRSAPPPAPRPVTPRTLMPAVDIPPLTAAAETPAPMSLETRVASVWFSRVGVIALLFAAAWLLKWAMDRGWIAPAERVTLGLAAGLVFWAVGERFWRRGYATMAYALFGVGNGVIYLSLWASFGLYHLLSSWVVFAPMLALTAWNGFRSWSNDSPVFAAYALLLGYLIPVLLANGQNHELQLFAFLLLIGAATVSLAALKPWKWLLPASFLATLMLAMGWAWQFYKPDLWLPTFIYVLAFLGLFLAACRVTAGRRPATASDGWVLARAYPAVIVGCAALALASLEPGVHHWLAWCALLAAVAGLALFLTVRPGATEWLGALRASSFAIALSFFLASVVQRFAGAALVRAVTLEGLVLLGVGARWRELRLSRGFAEVALLLAALFSAVDEYRSTSVIWNPVMGALLVALAGLAIAAWLSRQLSSDDETLGYLNWRQMSATFAGTALVLVWIIGLRAIQTAWWGGRVFVRPPELTALVTGSQFSYSAWCMAYGGVLLALGFWRRLPRLRWGGLLLLILAIAKVFLWDMSALSQGYRILSFLGLGALLLIVSFAYQRDWLGLRRQE